MPFLIAIAGGSGSGKTTLAKALSARIAADGHSSVVLAEDDYYRCVGLKPDFDPRTHDFDTPNAKDHALLAAHLAHARAGRAFEKPVYDFATHTRRSETQIVPPADIVIVDGLHAFAETALAGLYDLRVFLDASEALRLGRRIVRDVEERDRSPRDVLNYFFTIVAPAHARHVEPQKDQADLVLTSTGAGGMTQTERFAAAIAARAAP